MIPCAFSIYRMTLLTTCVDASCEVWTHSDRRLTIMKINQLRSKWGISVHFVLYRRFEEDLAKQFNEGMPVAFVEGVYGCLLSGANFRLNIDEAVFEQEDAVGGHK